jgi:cytochrome c biogenesis protein
MKTEKGKGNLKILIDFFRSLKLTIFLLILLAIVSIIGTIITQNATRDEYIERYGIELYKILNFFELFDMYHSWWFSTILLLLVINLISCSIQRFHSTWRQLFKKRDPKELEESALRSLPYVEKIHISNPIENFKDQIISILKNRFGRPNIIDGESVVTIFSEKGKFSRLGVYITHLSILIILIGGLLGSIYGFKGFVNILEGDTVDQIFLRIKDEEIPKPIGFSVRCDDFQITYYDIPNKEKYVKDYTSVLTIIENGKEVLKKTIEVNHPLHYKGLTFYQASYGMIHDITLGVTWRDSGNKGKSLLKIREGETIPIEKSNIFIKILRYAPQIHNFGEGVQVALFKPHQDPKVFWVLKNFPEFDKKRGDEFILTLEEVSSREYTGLQVTKDPGVWVVWIGCGLLVVGLFISFFLSHQRIWVRVPKNKGELIIAGSTNKNKFGFEKSFGELANIIKKNI